MLTNEFALTATHCIYDANETIFVSVNGNNYEAEVVFKAPDFEKQTLLDGRKDVAILKLKTVPDCVIPICLPEENIENLLVNDELVLASYQEGNFHTNIEDRVLCKLGWLIFW